MMETTDSSSLKDFVPKLQLISSRFTLPLRRYFPVVCCLGCGCECDEYSHGSFQILLTIDQKNTGKGKICASCNRTHVLGI